MLVVLIVMQNAELSEMVRNFFRPFEQDGETSYVQGKKCDELLQDWTVESRRNGESKDAGTSATFPSTAAVQDDLEQDTIQYRFIPQTVAIERGYYYIRTLCKLV